MRSEFKEDCKYGKEIRADLEALFEKWLSRYGLDIPEMDESLAAELILTEMKQELSRLEERYCRGSCDTEPPAC